MPPPWQCISQRLLEHPRDGVNHKLIKCVISPLHLDKRRLFMGKISGVLERGSGAETPGPLIRPWLQATSKAVYPNFIHFDQQSKREQTQPLAVAGWHNYFLVLNKVMMNGLGQTKTKRILLLQIRPLTPPCSLLHLTKKRWHMKGGLLKTLDKWQPTQKAKDFGFSSLLPIIG